MPQLTASVNRNATRESWALCIAAGFLGGMVIPVLGLAFGQRIPLPVALIVDGALLMTSLKVTHFVEGRVRAGELRRSASHGLLFFLGWAIGMAIGFWALIP